MFRYDAKSNDISNPSTKAAAPVRVTEDAEFVNVLATELNSLSLQDRNRVQEELHCVSSLALEETPELVEKSLGELWMRVREILISRTQYGNTTYEQDFLQALQHDLTYIARKETGLKYLRADLFQVEKAAHRMVNHNEMMYKYFGPIVLHRPLRYSDLNKEEQDCFRVGNQQILPSRDRNGRLVLVMQGALEGVEHRVRVSRLKT